MQSLLNSIVGHLDAAGIRHMAAGSFASTTHGDTRSTSDIDLVIDPDPERLDGFLDRLDPADYYVDRAGAHRALDLRDMFNVIDNRTTWKVDLYIQRIDPSARPSSSVASPCPG